MPIGCDFCSSPAEGEIEYKDGEVVLGCGDCLLEIVADPYKPVERIRELSKEERSLWPQSSQSSK